MPGMVFHTTASNTGAITAGFISVQSDFKIYLLWLACRHHIGEVLLNSVWDSLKIEVSKSPNVSLFTRFKENYKAVQYTDMDDLEIPAILPALEAKQDSIVQLCQEALKIGFVRGDYKELVLLTLLYFRDNESSFKRFERPGALHKAHWMSKILYRV